MYVRTYVRQVKLSMMMMMMMMAPRPNSTRFYIQLHSELLLARYSYNDEYLCGYVYYYRSITSQLGIAATQGDGKCLHR